MIRHTVPPLPPLPSWERGGAAFFGAAVLGVGGPTGNTAPSPAPTPPKTPHAGGPRPPLDPPHRPPPPPSPLWGEGGCGFVGSGDLGDGVADGDHVAFLGADRAQDAGGGGLELDRDLVGLDLGDGLALAHRVARGLDPAQELAGLLGQLERGHDDVGRHRYPLTFGPLTLPSPPGGRGRITCGIRPGRLRRRSSPPGPCGLPARG